MPTFAYCHASRKTMMNLFLLISLTCFGACYALQSSPIPALFAFGDSILDTGNNNHLPTIMKANFPPYGKDFPGHQPTGRFCNGKIPSDLLVSYAGLKEFLPAYLSPDLKDEDLLTGVCFASAGTGYDDLTARLLSLLSMSDQLELFKEYKQKLQTVAGEERAMNITSDALYIITGGSNDIMNTYFVTLLRKLQYDIPAYINFLIQSASSFVQNLHDLGARLIAVAGLPPLGCLPLERTLVGGIQRRCVALYNKVAVEYNIQLRQELQKLQKNHPESKIVYIDLYSKLLDIIQHPKKYGLVESSRGCCGTGKLEATFLCNNITSHTCSYDNKYVFWDSIHPTQRAYEILVAQLIKQYLGIIL